jgi:hypothetical protein
VRDPTRIEAAQEFSQFSDHAGVLTYLHLPGEVGTLGQSPISTLFYTLFRASQ